ncbi:autotransporter outer membrane beta-barrel domain-containing protein [Halodesulfovibrio marinisediminis]|uniref:Outer membrane autotransporter barrel domain-containing protein n=1 Tax=Halodesulfovibrio marinisediminis DSM 17456 TaxID=1121457 RepID=A0A1N6I4I2_9BACT|nr:autotransporter outer membrane beta-barrel domain-containing protein [Halodesulfovibrio marinisediminis]SIO26932.1 outer membrane autotransporter barrel domain-containing protein [Halodesulfovibrio marinisediminis DSM 17456]
MEHNIPMLKAIRSVCLVIALVASSQINATADVSAQHVTNPFESQGYAEEITAPYIVSSPSYKNYWGLFFDNQGAAAPDSYTIASSIVYDELSIDGNNFALYDIQNQFSNMALNVSKHLQINASGADNATINGFVNLVGIDSVGSVTTSSDASMVIIGKGAGALGAGAITVQDVRADVKGIQTTGDGAALTVNGDVTVEAHGGCTQYDATGQTNAQATGILHSGSSGEIENSGTLNVKAYGGILTSQNANVKANGITSNSSEVRITNRGNINVEGRGGKTTSSKTYAHAGVAAYGIDGESEVVNYGNISVYAKSGSGMTSSINASGIRGADIENHGSITVESIGGVRSTSTSKPNSYENTYGLYSTGSLNNSGKVSVTSQGGKYLESGTELPSTVFAAGLYSTSGELKNTGDISVRVEGASCNAGRSSDRYAWGIGVQTYAATITNTGTIDVHVVGGSVDTDNGGIPLPAYARGIRIYNDATLNSSGLIRVTAEMSPSITASIDPENQRVSTYQVVSTADLRITGYAMEIGHEQNVFNRMYQGTIYSSGELTFDNTTLYVHLTDNYKNGLYDIPRLWKQETAEQKAATPNQFASLASVNVPPGVKVELFPGNASTPQRIGLNYEPKVSTPLKQALISMELESHIQSIIHDDLAGRMMFSILPDSTPQQSDSPDNGYGVSSATSTMVASLSNPNVLPVITAKQPNLHSVFMRPVYVNSYDSASSGYSSNTYGFVLGYNYNVNEERNDCYVGFHAGYTRGDIRYTGEDYGKRKEFVDTYFGGVHGIRRFDNNLMLSGEASFFYVDSDMTDNNPTNRETARHDSISIRAEAGLGYLWTINGHNIIPEIGLQYVWQHRDPFTTDNVDSADITYGTMDNHELYGNVRLKWTKQFVTAGDWRITPLIGAGVTQLLTDGEISNTMRLGNETQLVVDQGENTTFTPEANITVGKDTYYATIGYTGGFGGTTKNNLFWLQLGVKF